MNIEFTDQTNKYNVSYSFGSCVEYLKSIWDRLEIELINHNKVD